MGVAWPALHAAAARTGGWDSKYLPSIDDFEGHVGWDQAFLIEAARRQAGVLALVSA